MALWTAVTLTVLASSIWPLTQPYVLDMSTTSRPQVELSSLAAEDADEQDVSGLDSSPGTQVPVSGPLGDVSSVWPAVQGRKGSSRADIVRDGAAPCDAQRGNCGVAGAGRDHLNDSLPQLSDSASPEDTRKTSISSEVTHTHNVVHITTSPALSDSSADVATITSSKTSRSADVTTRAAADPRVSTAVAPTSTITTGPQRTVKSLTPQRNDKAKAGPRSGGKKTSSTARTSVSSQSTHHLAKHFTGFVQHVWLPNSTPRPPGPIDDGPFGSILWRDKKYLVSVLIPIGVGFAGAMMIIVMAYASRAWRKRKERQAHGHGAPGSFLEAATSKNDDMAPLHESSDDEF